MVPGYCLLRTHSNAQSLNLMAMIPYVHNSPNVHLAVCNGRGQTMASGKFVSYLRVSTSKQGRSGLGLEAQRNAVEQYLDGGRWELLAEYVEVESGKKNDRPELIRAMHHAKVTGATLIIAKLDRLARNVHFISGLMETGVDFVAVDMPEANRFTIHIFAAAAEHEREMASQRTKAALQAAKARGVKLGNPNGAAHLKGFGNDQAVAAIQEAAQHFAEELRPIVEDIRAHGVASIRGICSELNRRSITTPRDRQWHPTGVARLLSRLE